MTKKLFFSIIVGVFGCTLPLSFGIELGSLYYWVTLVLTVIVLINVYKKLKDD